MSTDNKKRKPRVSKYDMTLKLDCSFEEAIKKTLVAADKKIKEKQVKK